MKSWGNYYKLLHVQPDAPTEIIKSSYRTLMLKLKHHPDMGGDDGQAALINQAYETLIHPEKRARYDRELLRSREMTAGSASEILRPKETRLKNECAAYQNLMSMPTYSCAFCRTSQIGELRAGIERRCNCCGSPLNPVAESACLNDRQRRAVKRIAQRSRVTFYTAWPQCGFTGHIRDLSPLGMQIDAQEMLRESQLIKIESDILHATANVVYCRGTSNGGCRCYVIGFKFLTLWFRRPIGTFLSITA